MDSVEVAVRFTEAIMAKSRVNGKNPAETYVDMFAEVLKRVTVVMNLSAAPPDTPRAIPEHATSDIFPLSHERRR